MRQMRQRIKEKCPRVYKIIDKTAEMIVWTPIFLVIYAQVLGLSYAYYKSDNKCDKRM